MNLVSNTFCASGMHLPNGSWALFGGNTGVAPGGNDTPLNVTVDPIFQDYDGRKAIRLLQPCTGPSNSFGDACQWFDDTAALSMQRMRWYAAVESLPDGSVVIIGGSTWGGCVIRRFGCLLADAM